MSSNQNNSVRGRVSSISRRLAGQRVRMKHDICLTTESCIPKESIALTVDTGRTTYHMLMIFGDEQPACIGLGGLDEELVVGDITLRFEPMVLM